jgi:hypothetical protein
LRKAHGRGAERISSIVAADRLARVVNVTWTTTSLIRIVPIGTARGDFVKTYDNERWRIADQTAAFLQFDRDVCRRAFYREPLNLVSEVVGWVRSCEDDPDYDGERLVEDWARDVGAGVYDEDRRYESDLVHVGEAMSGVFRRLALERPELDDEYDYHLYLICVRLKEHELGRQLTTSELDQFTRRFYAPNYWRDLGRIPKEEWDQLHLELEHEEHSTRRKRPPSRRAG